MIARFDRPVAPAGGLLAVVAVLALALFTCGKPILLVSVGTVGATREAPLAIEAGAQLSFGVKLGAFSHKGDNHVLVTADLLRGGQVVASMASCRGYYLENSGAGCSGSEYNPDCALKVPAGGATSVRVATKLERPSASVTIENLEIDVRRH